MNVVTINSARHNKLEDVKTVITLDNEIHQNIVDKIKSLTNIIRVRIIHKIKDEW
jgi:cell division protein FtsX